jgi:hypothetical protein
MASIPETPPAPGVGKLLEDIGRDLKTIAVDELELAHGQLTRFFESLVAKAGMAILGATVALIGLGMLCTVAVIAAEPLIHRLWLRLLVMALLYIGIGGGLAVIYAKRLATMHGPELDKQLSEVGETIAAVSAGLKH